MPETQIFQIDPDSPQPEIIRLAAGAIRAGRLVVFPTETVYGVGADALNETAVAKIFAAKQRPITDPLIVHIGTLEQLIEAAHQIPLVAWQLAEQFWPGPLTLILPKTARIPANVTAGLATVAVRMPNHPVALALLQQSGTMIAAPSANLFTRPSPTAAGHVLEDLAGRVDIILDGGPPAIGLESTVVDLTVSPPAVLRPGGTPVEALGAIIPDLVIKPRYLSESDGGLASPGMLAKHYSPQATVILVEGADETAVLGYMRAEIQAQLAQGKRLGVMVTAEAAPSLADLAVTVAVMGAAADLKTIGQSLFAKLRELDAAQVELILVQGVEAKGLGLAIRDRLVRAAEGRVVRVKT